MRTTPATPSTSTENIVLQDIFILNSISVSPTKLRQTPNVGLRERGRGF